MKIGVLALQGAFIEHIEIFSRLGAEITAVRLPGQLKGLDGMVIPGGESTTIMKLMSNFCLITPLRKLIRNGLPVWGTCAGMICLANRICDSGLKTLGVIDMQVRRNAFGRQVDSFEVDLPVPALGEKPFSAVFIRAPIIENVGTQVEVLAALKGKAVAARQGNLLATAFHPELTDDIRFHSYFIKIVTTAKAGRLK